MYFPGGFGFHVPVGRFEQEYHVYPVSFLDKAHLENGDKVIMPPSALDRLASLHIDYPMLFEVQNTATNRRTHCGVLEFVADEGQLYMPYWMMQNLLLEEGDVVRMTNATLHKGTYVKLQPHTKDFLEISNPKAVLETTLRNFSCLTTGDNIMVAYNNKKYYIDIVETRPEPAISIIETDCEVDFAPPLDYVEPVREPPPKPRAPALAFGRSRELGGSGPAGKGPAKEQADPPPEPVEPSFQPFSGSGRRLDGKAGTATTAGGGGATGSTSSSAGGAGAGPSSSSSSRGTGAAGSAPAGAAQGKASTGRLVFGGGGPSKPGTNETKAKEKQPEEKQDEGPKFQAFSGKSYSLR